jgi:chromosome segregation ATPase
MTLSGKEAAAFETWKQREGERMKAAQRQEMGILIDKIRRDWAAQQARVSRDWEAKEGRILEIFTKIETVIGEFKAANAERQTLEAQLQALEQENDELKKIPPDSTRQERLVRINNLRLEIERLEGDLTRADAEVRATNESKNRYKRLFLESNTVLNEMLQEQKQKHKPKAKPRRRV